jgi:hypothetical protein
MLDLLMDGRWSAWADAETRSENNAFVTARRLIPALHSID